MLPYGSWSMRARHMGILHDVIQTKVQEFRLVQCQKFVSVMAKIFTVPMLVTTIHVHTLGANEPAAPELARCWACALCVYCLLLLVATGHIQLTHRGLDSTLVGLLGILTSHSARRTDDPGFFVDSGLLVFVRLAVGIGFLDNRKFVPCNLMCSIVLCWRYPHNCPKLSATYDQYEHMVFCAKEAFTFMWVSYGPQVIQAQLQTRFQGQIVGHSQSRSMCRLAENQCDAVFRLTPDLRLKGPAPKLAHLLIVPSQNDLEGTHFKDHMATQVDWDNFYEFLLLSTISSEAEDMPGSVRVDLRGATSQALPVEAFHSCYVDDGNQVSHIVGIRVAPAPGSNCGSRDADQQPDERLSARASLAIAATPGVPMALAQSFGRSSSAKSASFGVGSAVARSSSQAGVGLGYAAPTTSDAGATSSAAAGSSDVGVAQDHASSAKGSIDATRIAAFEFSSDVGMVQENSSNDSSSDVATSSASAVSSSDDEEAPRHASSATISSVATSSRVDVSRGGRLAVAAGSVPSNSADDSLPALLPLMPLIPEHKASAPVSVVFDAMTCELIGCTAGFATLVGPAGFKTNILKLIANRKEFLWWMQHWANYLAQQTSVDCPALNLQLKQPKTRTRQKNFNVHAEAILARAGINVRPSAFGVEHCDDGKDDVRCMLCVLELRGAELRWVERKINEKRHVAQGTAPATQSAQNF